jgi:UDP-N-acetylglucosamine--N-acetylmuramyl-(pentapeptide) pyrophosphoryl-undecaprenol N-acetylglucosamine transferase
MTCTDPRSFPVAIACGGTGGHLFPGVAVAAQLRQCRCAVTLLVSPKQVDQEAVKGLSGVEVITLPAVGLERGRVGLFCRRFAQSYCAARRVFRERPPKAVLAMGGFTSAPPILAARRMGCRTFLHESNTVPGRANRWLSWIVQRSFLGFPSAAGGLHCRNVTVTGTPVRPEFRSVDPGPCRTALGLDAERPVVLVVGGSQGASAINDLVSSTLPLLAKTAPEWQWIHATGHRDLEKVRQVYAALQITAIVHPFFREMEVVLGAASAAVSRAGASSLAELAAVRLPAILVPYPSATDNHQWHNAQALAASGAARLLEQGQATAEVLAEVLLLLVRSAAERAKVQAALARWHAPLAAEQIAEVIMAEAGAGRTLGRGKICRDNSDPKETECRTTSAAGRLVSGVGARKGGIV